MTVDELLQSAIQAAKAGQRERARQMFIEVLKQDQYNLMAWVWLSDVAEDLPHRIGALERALKIRPNDPLLLGRMEALREQLPKPAPYFPVDTSSQHQDLAKQQAIQEKIIQAGHLAQASRSVEAVALLQEAIALDEQNEHAWLLLSELQPRVEDRVAALEKASTINPSNEDAARKLASLREAMNDPFKRGQYLEEQGDFEGAINIYTSIITHSRLASERVDATRRIEDIHLRLEADRLQPVNPDLNLARLTLGPVFLFLIMVFMQSGLNVLRTPFLEFLGIMSVLAGSLMVAVTGMRPIHPRWVKIFGEPGSGDEPELRRAVRLLGFALLLAPYTMFLVDAGHRLGVLQASVLGR